MPLDNPICKRFVIGITPYETDGQRIDLILIECPSFEKPTSRLVLQVNGLFFRCFLLNSVTKAVPHHHETQAGH